MGMPLPLLGINNLRSLVSIENLIRLLIICVNHPNAPGNTFLISDGHDVSTATFAKNIAHEVKRDVFLFYMPVFILRFLASIFGMKKSVKKITDSLRVDIGYTIKTLGWFPLDR